MPATDPHQIARTLGVEWTKLAKANPRIEAERGSLPSMLAAVTDFAKATQATDKPFLAVFTAFKAAYEARKQVYAVLADYEKIIIATGDKAMKTAFDDFRKKTNLDDASQKVWDATANNFTLVSTKYYGGPKVN